MPVVLFPWLHGSMTIFEPWENLFTFTVHTLQTLTGFVAQVIKHRMGPCSLLFRLDPEATITIIFGNA